MAANRGADQESFRDLGSARVIFAPIGKRDRGHAEAEVPAADFEPFPLAAGASVILSTAKDLGRDSSLRYAAFTMTRGKLESLAFVNS